MAEHGKKSWLYTLGPIDYWQGWTKLEVGPKFKSKPRWYADMVRRAGEVFLLKSHWEGDGSWYMSALPDPDCSDSALILAVKQSNNGSVFVLSQMELSYLEKGSLIEKAVVVFDWHHDEPGEWP